MEPSCTFWKDYVPAHESRNSAVVLHVKNCADCQDQFYVPETLLAA